MPMPEYRIDKITLSYAEHSCVMEYLSFKRLASLRNRIMTHLRIPRHYHIRLLISPKQHGINDRHSPRPFTQFHLAFGTGYYLEKLDLIVQSDNPNPRSPLKPLKERNKPVYAIHFRANSTDAHCSKTKPNTLVTPETQCTVSEPINDQHDS